MEAVVKYLDNDVRVSVHLANIQRAEFGNGCGTVEDVNGAKLVADISGGVTLELVPEEEQRKQEEGTE